MAPTVILPLITIKMAKKACGEFPPKEFFMQKCDKNSNTELNTYLCFPKENTDLA